MKRMIIGFSTFILFIVSTFCYADTLEVFKNKSYDLNLESKSLKAGSGIVEIFDIDIIENKLPDQIYTTVEAGEWVYSLPGIVTVSNADNEVDKMTEYWEVNFAKVKNGGRVIFTRTITNNDSVNRESYSWNLKLKCRYIKYR